MELEDDKPRMIVIGAGESMGRSVALALAESLCMHVEYQSEDELDKIQGLKYHAIYVDELNYNDYICTPRSRGKGKKNKPWEHNYV